jgi:hypothetical protein
MKFLIFLFLPLGLFSQQIHIHNIPDPPTKTVYVKEYEKIDTLKLDSTYYYEYFKLENEEVYLIRVKKKKPKKDE